MSTHCTRSVARGGLASCAGKPSTTRLVASRGGRGTRAAAIYPSTTMASKTKKTKVFSRIRRFKGPPLRSTRVNALEDPAAALAAGGAAVEAMKHVVGLYKLNPV